LLEKILLHSTAEDILLRLQLVARTWKNTVDGSLKIGRLLFRQSDPDAGLECFPIGVERFQELRVHRFQGEYAGPVVLIIESGMKGVEDLACYQALQQAFVVQRPLKKYEISIRVPGRNEGVASGRGHAPSGLTFSILWRELRGLRETSGEKDRSWRETSRVIICMYPLY
jgi:hypothetical protein